MASFLFKSFLPLSAAAAMLPVFDTDSKPATHAFSAFAGPVEANADGRLEIFGIGQNDNVWDNWQTSPSGGWHGWNNLNQQDSKPGVVVARNLNLTLEVFVIGGDKNIWRNHQGVPNGYWSGWKNMGGSGITNVAAAVNADGRIQLFGLGKNATVWSNWQLVPNGEWHGWTNFGGSGMQSGFVAKQNIDGCLDLFAVGKDASVWHKRQTSPNAEWGEWMSLGGAGIHPRMAVARNAEGCLELFGIHNSEVWHSSQTTPGGQQWSGWTNLGGPGIQPGFVVGINWDGRLEIFGVGNNGDVWHLWQNNGGSWNDWNDLGGPGSDPQLAVGNNADGRLQVFAVGQNADIWSNWQITPGNNWNGWNDMGGRGTKLFSGQIIRRMPQYISSLWQMGDGLPCNAVEAITQTHDGYLWVGTQKGLVRFDGQRFVRMDSLFPEFPARCVNALCEGKNGELWIGVEGGTLFCLKQGKMERFQKSNGLANGNVKTIYAARNGSVWIGASGGLSCYEAGKLRAYTVADGLVDNDVRTIVEDDDGLLWIGTPRGLNTFRNGSVAAVYTNLNELPDKYGVSERSVAALCDDKTGGLWIGTANGMVHRRGGDFRDHFRSDNFGLSDNSIAALHRDRKGVLWIGTDNGLNCWAEGNACITLLDNDGSGFDEINAISEDFEGNIWVGGKEGLRRLKPKVLTTYGRQAGFTQNNIMSVMEDKDNAMWIAIWGGGLNRFKDGNITTYSMGPVLRTDLILSICARRDGSIWFGTDHAFGLYYLEQKTLRHYNIGKGMLQGTIRVIYEDQQNELWLGDGDELTLLRAGKPTSYTTKDGLAGNVVQAILEDRRRNLWFGTDGGLSRLTGGKFTNFTMQQGLSANSINALYEDNEQTLWIGTIGGGLNRFRDGKFQAYTTAQGLFSDDVLAILEDNHGSLWMSCFNGIFRVRKETLNDLDLGKIKTIPCASYGKSDGMASSQCNGVAQPAGWKDKNGKLWFPTTKGLVVADPNTQFNETPPPVMIEEIFADKQKSQLNLYGSNTPLRIKPGRGELEFHYTALSLQEPEKNRFKYKLEGFDPEWVDAGPRRVAYYDNLSPGSYKFRVIACNNDGAWNEAGLGVALVVLPHFWQTAWFFTIITLVAVSVLAGSVRHLTSRKLHLELAVLEQQHAVEKERSRIARDMHDDLGARLSEVLLLSDLTRKNGGKPEEVRALTGKISRAARDLVDSLDALVWAVNPRNDSLDRFADYVAETSALYLETSGIRCVFELPPRLPALPLSSEVRHNLFLVVKEALHNIVKHADASEARISLCIENDILSLHIADNGRGFPDSAYSRSGNGLINMEDRMKKIGASFHIAKRPGNGTLIAVNIPVGPALTTNKHDHNQNHVH